MMRSRVIVWSFASATIVALGPGVEPNPARWSGQIGLITSAAAQIPLEGCEEFLIHQTANDATYYKCDNGKYYRRTGDEYVEVDEQGRVITDPKGTQAEPEPDNATVASPSEPAVEPDFKKAPDQNSGEAGSHFKKVPE